MKLGRMSSTCAICVAMALIAGAGPARAVVGAGAILLEFDTSVRSAGMGSATTAVFWGGDPNAWANPALLGYHRGLRYQHQHSPLAAGLATDIFLNNDQVTFGAYGVGLLFAGKPVGAKAGNFLDMGTQIATDETGIQIGTFQSWMKADAWGVGVSLAEAFDTIRGRAGPDGGGIARYGDVALGWTHKRYEDLLADDQFLQDRRGGSGKATMLDMGLLVRATPYNSIDNPGTLPGLDEALRSLGGARLDVSYGWSDLNYNNAVITHVDAAQSDPAPRMHRRGLAVHAALGLPPALRESLGGGSLLAESLAPLVSLSMSWDRVTPWVHWDPLQAAYVFAEDPNDADVEHLRGMELVLGNVFYWRTGHVTERVGEIDGSTSGWGLGFKLADIGGFRYDHAKVPQATGLPQSKRSGFTMFVDGIALWQWLH